jgi:hypothetical protein
MSTFTCAVCGKAHDTLPLDLAYKRPFDYFTIPEAERDDRIKISADLCSIDDHAFYIRGYLPVPIHDTDQEFGWGVWVRVDEASFYRYLELWEMDGSQEPPFHGWLSAELRGYPSTNRLEADVHLRGARDRPAIYLRPSDHPFVQEQLHGIPMARVHEIVHTAMPWLFEA